MYRLKYNKVIFLVNISLHEYSSSFVFTQNLKNTRLFIIFISIFFRGYTDVLFKCTEEMFVA